MADKEFRLRWLGYAVVAAAAVVFTVSIALVQLRPRTDDATVRANAIELAPEVEGRLVQLNVQDNQPVRKGDLLFQIDPRPYEYALEQARSDQAALEGQIDDERRRIASQKAAVETARAGVSGSESSISSAQSAYLSAQAATERARAAKDAANAQLRFARSDYDRIVPLLAKRYVTAQQADQAQTTVRVAEQTSNQAASQLLEAQAQEKMAQASEQAANANLQASQSRVGEAQYAVDTLETLIAQRPSRAAKVNQAALNLDWTSVRAPFDGYVANLNISTGAYAHVGTPIFTLIDTGRWYVLANFRESKLKHIHEGQHVQVYLMDQPARSYEGVVDSVGRGVFPEDGATQEGLPSVNRTLNWVHLSARFPVRIRVLEPDPNAFRIGATATAVIR